MVGTPIGNRDDITVRALRVLQQVDYIAAEDTRSTGRFLTAHGIRGNCISYHEHNEERRTEELLTKLQSGHSIALVSDAGTPTLSDPGYRLISRAVAGMVPVIPIPGVSAAITALSVSGLPTDAFVFAGFIAKKPGKRTRQLQQLSDESRTIIFYESPKRILGLLEDLMSVFGDRNAVIAREMTKAHEEFLRGKLSGLIALLGERKEIRGECTLLVSGCGANGSSAIHAARRELREKIRNEKGRPSKIAREVAVKHGISKNVLYDEALRLQESTRK